MHPRRSLGFIRIMKLIQRRVHGFGNFNNHRLRVTAQCGWLIPTANRQNTAVPKLWWRSRFVGRRQSAGRFGLPAVGWAEAGGGGVISTRTRVALISVFQRGMLVRFLAVASVGRENL
jgi:hypothetical protein